jgi:Transposase, Mutator family
VAVGDIVPVPGAQFEQTLASASPDALREMIRGFAQKMMDADVEIRCNAGYGEVTPDRVNSRNGYRAREWDTRGGDGRAGDPEAAGGVVLPVVPGAPAPRGAGAGLGGGHVVPAGGLDVPAGQADQFLARAA